MQKLVQRVREVVAAESDDFFQADTILYYLNKTQQKIQGYAVTQEAELVREGNVRKSLRCLDSLREQQKTDVTTLNFESVGNYYKTQLEYPTGMNQFNFMKYGTRTVLRELNTFDLVRLDWGNLRPHSNEGYFYATSTESGDKSIFEIYLHEDESGGAEATNYIYLYYIKEPTPLTLDSTTMTEFPSRLENAMIYGAAMMMVMQESVENPQAQIEQFRGLYQEELSSNIY